MATPVLGTLPFVAVRQHHREAAGTTPLGLARGDELVDDDLGAVDEVAELGFLTPAQQTDSSVRTAIDGFPIDVFSAESMEDTPAYYGQYNLRYLDGLFLLLYR